MKNLFRYIFIFSQFCILSCSNNIKNESQNDNNPSVDSIGKHYRDSLSSEYNNSGNMKRLAQDYQGAVVDYTKAIGITSMFHINEDVELNSLSNRGYSKFKLQDYTGAIPDFSKVIEMGPELAQYQYGISYYFRGLSKLNLQDYNGTIADFNMIIEMDPKYSRGVLKEEVYYYRGFTKLKLNQKDNACLDLSKAGEMGYGQAYELIKQYCN
ncbi:MAG: hypothetical protein V4547_03325 [Bacteroidota bacterium]